jgi:hypothetical protein
MRKLSNNGPSNLKDWGRNRSLQCYQKLLQAADYDKHSTTVKYSTELAVAPVDASFISSSRGSALEKCVSVVEASRHSFSYTAFPRDIAEAG